MQAYIQHMNELVRRVNSNGRAEPIPKISEKTLKKQAAEEARAVSLVVSAHLYIRLYTQTHTHKHTCTHKHTRVLYQNCKEHWAAQRAREPVHGAAWPSH